MHRKQLVGVTVSLYSAATLGIAFTSHVWLVALLRAILGTLLAVLPTALISLVIDFFPSHKRNAMNAVIFMGF